MLPQHAQTDLRHMVRLTTRPHSLIFDTSMGGYHEQFHHRGATTRARCTPWAGLWPNDLEHTRVRTHDVPCMPQRSQNGSHGDLVDRLLRACIRADYTARRATKRARERDR